LRQEIFLGKITGGLSVLGLPEMTGSAGCLENVPPGPFLVYQVAALQRAAP
jgi:hypothetical protein